MRFIISAIGAVLVLSTVSSTPSAAQNAMTQLTNSCIDLARQRGWTESDLDGNRREIRNFIARCVQGREARAQQRPKQKRSQ